VNKLKPCPFCGTEHSDDEYPLIHIEHATGSGAKPKEYYWVMCWNCRTRGPLAYTEKAAIRKWNKRINTNE